MIPMVTDIAKCLTSHPYQVDSQRFPVELAAQARLYLSYCSGTRHAEEMDKVAEALGGKVVYPSIHAPDFVEITIAKDGTFIIVHPFMKGPRLDNLHTAEGIGMYLTYAIMTKEVATKIVYPVKRLPKNESKKLKEVLSHVALEFAFNFLMPEDVFRARVNLYRTGKNSKEVADGILSHLGMYFPVSQYVLQKRLEGLSLIENPEELVVRRM